MEKQLVRIGSAADDNVGDELVNLNFSQPVFKTSLDLTNVANRALAMRAMQQTDKNIGDCLGETLVITDVLCQAVTLVKETTGEVVNTVRTVLIAKDRTTYGCVSDGIRKSVGMIVGLVGPPTWLNGITVVPKQLNTKKRNRVYFLDLIETAPPPPPSPEKPPKGK